MAGMTLGPVRKQQGEGFSELFGKGSEPFQLPGVPKVWRVSRDAFKDVIHDPMNADVRLDDDLWNGTSTRSSHPHVMKFPLIKPTTDAALWEVIGHAGEVSPAHIHKLLWLQKGGRPGPFQTEKAMPNILPTRTKTGRPLLAEVWWQGDWHLFLYPIDGGFAPWPKDSLVFVPVSAPLLR